MKKIIIVLLLALVSVQFIRIDISNPRINPVEDYVNVTQAPDTVKKIIKTSCYDCHSNETIYPWYANIAPVSWYVKDHINDGRKHLNFSEFGNYNQYQRGYIEKKLFYSIKQKRMPLHSYLWAHTNAKLSNKDQKTLMGWFQKFTSETSK